MILLPFFYAVRPLIVRPMRPTGFELLNIAAVVIADILIVQYWGGRALGWLLLSCYFGLRYNWIWASGFHPLAVHLIAEHYEFINRLETYNYIGWANFFIMNIGYHTEHHDFPMIPWSRLPLVRRMAPEFYEHLPCYDSYLEVAFHYVFDEFMGPFSRIIRKTKKELWWMLVKYAMQISAVDTLGALRRQERESDASFDRMRAVGNFSRSKLERFGLWLPGLPVCHLHLHRSRWATNNTKLRPICNNEQQSLIRQD